MTKPTETPPDGPTEFRLTLTASGVVGTTEQGEES